MQMTLLGRSRLTPRIHAYAASFGEDFAREIIHDYAEKGSAVLDPFVGAGTTVLESILSNRNAIGIDVDPIACRISRVISSRFDVPYLVTATEDLKEKLRSFESLLASDPAACHELGPGSTFTLGSSEFFVPTVPAIAFWFDPSHMATLSIIRETVACEGSSLVRQAFEVAISSCIIRKWPNTLSYAMDIDHSRPHRPNTLRAQTISEQFALFYRVLNRVRDTILGIQESLASVESSARILEGDSNLLLAELDSDSIGFVLTSPPYLNAIDYPRAHKFSQWWISPQTTPLGRSEYIGLRHSEASNSDANLSSPSHGFSELFAPFQDMPIYRNISRYVADLVEVIHQLYRIARARAKVAFVVANNIIGGEVFPVSAIIEELLKRSGFSSVNVTRRTIKNTRRRYPFGVNGFAGPMKDEYLITGTK